MDRRECTTLVIACQMLEDEISAIVDLENLEYDIIWVDRGLHEVPATLKNKLQELIDEHELLFDEIILCFGACGNALQGLKSKTARLASFRHDDCIRMLLPEGVNMRGLYFTAGWLRSDRFIGNEYKSFLQKHGKEKTDKVYKMILREYRHLFLVDTGAYELKEYLSKAQETARTLGLDFGIVTSRSVILHKLLTHQWDEDIRQVCPGHSFD